jgi:cytochrome b6-f complex iron-sulfur subunit
MRLSRRDLAKRLGLGAFVLAAGSAATALARFAYPNLTTQREGTVEIGAPDAYPIGTLAFVPEARVYLGCDERGYYAIDATCTHLGCTPRLDAEGFVCPCHGSRFDRDGQVTSGPAPRALDRVYVGRAASGRLVVDRRKTVDSSYRLPV